MSIAADRDGSVAHVRTSVNFEVLACAAKCHEEINSRRT